MACAGYIKFVCVHSGTKADSMTIGLFEHHILSLDLCLEFFILSTFLTSVW